MNLPLSNLMASFPLLAESENPLTHAVDHALVMTESGWWLLSNHTVMLLVAFVVCLVIFIPLSAKYRSGVVVPSGTHNFFEVIIMYLRNTVAKPLLGDYTDFYMPLLWTIFFFVWVVNLLGLIPIDLVTGKLLGLGAHGHGIYGTATGNIWVTGTLALVTFVVVQVTGIIRNGLGTYLKHFLGGAPVWLAPVMIPVEILGTLIKPFSLAIRLFANMTAGHVLLGVIIGFTAAVGAAYGYVGSLGIALIVVPAGVALMFLELFVATLQAYLFMFLSCLFISQMLPHDHGHGHDDHEHDHGHDRGHAAKAGAH